MLDELKVDVLKELDIKLSACKTLAKPRQKQHIGLLKLDSGWAQILFLLIFTVLVPGLISYTVISTKFDYLVQQVEENKISLKQFNPEVNKLRLETDESAHAALSVSINALTEDVGNLQSAVKLLESDSAGKATYSDLQSIITPIKTKLVRLLAECNRRNKCL